MENASSPLAGASFLSHGRQDAPCTAAQVLGNSNEIKSMTTIKGRLMSNHH